MRLARKLSARSKPIKVNAIQGQSSSLRSRPSSASVPARRCSAAVDGDSGPGRLEAEAGGELLRRAARRVRLERVRVDDADQAVGFDDARFPPVAGESATDPAPLRSGPRRRRASGGPSGRYSRLARPVAPGPVAGRGEPEDLAATLGPLQQRRLAAAEPREDPGVGSRLDPRDRVEDRAAEVAMLGVGEGLEDGVLRLPSIEPPGQLRRPSRDRGPSPRPGPAASRLRAAPAARRSPVKTSRPPPFSTNSGEALRVRPAEVVHVRQHDGLGLVEVGQSRAAGEHRPSWGRRGTWHSARPSVRAGARPGGSRSPLRTGPGRGCRPPAAPATAARRRSPGIAGRRTAARRPPEPRRARATGPRAAPRAGTRRSPSRRRPGRPSARGRASGRRPRRGAGRGTS